jgi:hypothetical protein
MCQHLADDGMTRAPVAMRAGIRPHAAIQRADHIASAGVGVNA